MDSQDRIDFKLGAKAQVLDHFKFYFLLTILWLALGFIGGLTYQRSMNWIMAVNNNSGFVLGGGLSLAGVLTIASAIMRVGSQLTMIDLDRGKITMDSPLQRSFALFDKGQYFLGWLFIAILVGIFTFLWSLLFFVPGMIKAYAYSQSFYIYRDAIDRNDPITPLEAITESRRLMDGNKAFLFIMDLSFIGWMMLQGITFGFAALFVQPYYDQTRAKFYNQLVIRDEDQPAADTFDGDQGPEA
ncbi:integral membrane protein [Levilactobacillus paucivorans]|uniref:Integral membrane protein n=1 Tax=Levilactobacillus paucivorans TaxID=616990 RepID=A0A0R2M0Y6_9LACO|nr:DUF975 family protein [Levilactobacillus paucivorans]KRO04499.1 integral membrane protein [Levilactobacillus paucivorans]